MRSELSLKMSKEDVLLDSMECPPGRQFWSVVLGFFYLFDLFFSVLFSFSAFSEAAGTVIGL